ACVARPAKRRSALYWSRPHGHAAPVTHCEHWKGGGFVPVPCGASGRVWGAHARVSADDAGGTGTPAAQWGDWSRAHARVRGDPGVARVVRDRRPGRTSVRRDGTRGAGITATARPRPAGAPAPG